MNNSYRHTPVAILLVLLALAGCSGNPALELRYEAERHLHEAERAMQKAQINPDLTTHEMIDDVVYEYRETAQFSLSALEQIDRQNHPVEYREIRHIAFTATNQVARLLYMQRSHAEAIDLLNRLLGEQELAREQLLITRINLGRAYQGAGQWDSAVALYDLAVEEFYPPTDQQGEIFWQLFNLPAHMYEVASKTGDSAAASAHYENAVAYYTELLDDYPGTRLEPAARVSLAKLYEQTERYEEELAQIDALSDTTSSAYASVRMKAADIYSNRLGNHSKALEILNGLFEDATPNDSVLYPMLKYKIAVVKMEQNKYSEAREILNNLKEQHRGFYGQVPMAQFALARSFELDNNWSRAEVEYNYLIENYRASDEALGAFLHIAQKLENMGRKAEANRWYRNAEEHYNQVAALGQGTVLEAKAMSYKAELARQQENWQEAANTLQAIFDRFPATPTGQRALLTAAVLHREQLDNQAAADSLIEVLRASLTELDNRPEM